MNTNNEKTITLTSSDDWESWNLQFQAQAVAGNIWKEIEGLTPFLSEPTAPDPANHKHKAPSQSTITARGSTVPTDDRDTETGSQTITIADLITDRFRTYQIEQTIFQANKKEYN